MFLLGISQQENGADKNVTIHMDVTHLRKNCFYIFFYKIEAVCTGSIIRYSYLQQRCLESYARNGMKLQLVQIKFCYIFPY